MLPPESSAVADRIQSPGDRCSFDLTVEQAAVVSVRMNRLSGDLDPYLMLLNDNGEILMEDDDSAGDDDALIKDYTMQLPGQYTIIARDYGDAATGDFELSVDIESKKQ